MSDKLRMDFINSLPQPFFARFGGSTAWWPIIDLDVETALCRLDIMGRMQVESFADVVELKDGFGNVRDPNDFWNEDGQ